MSCKKKGPSYTFIPKCNSCEIIQTNNYTDINRTKEWLCHHLIIFWCANPVFLCSRTLCGEIIKKILGCSIFSFYISRYFRVLRWCRTHSGPSSLLSLNQKDLVISWYQTIEVGLSDNGSVTFFEFSHCIFTGKSSDNRIFLTCPCPLYSLYNTNTQCSKIGKIVQ